MIGILYPFLPFYFLFPKSGVCGGPGAAWFSTVLIFHKLFKFLTLEALEFEVTQYINRACSP